MALLAAATAVLSLGSGVRADASADALLAGYLRTQERHLTELLRLPGVTGTGVGMSEREPGRLVIRLYVDPGTSEHAKHRLPTEIDGAPVEVIENPPVTPQ